MDSGGSMQSYEERGVEKFMDDYLKSIGLHRKKIAKDGSCLFRAVAEQVLHCQSLHTTVRARCVEFLKQNRDSYEAFIEGDFEDYLCKLQDPQQWVGEVEINALAVMYKRDFLIYQEPGKPAVNITDKNFKDKVQLCFLNGNHYDSVYPISRVKNAALCQSVLYELLYDDVFKVDRSFLGQCQRTGRPSDLLSDDSMPACGSSDDSDGDTGDALWVENGTSTTSTRHNNHGYRGRGRGRHLPERVRRSLNPTLLRNVEYDVWNKTKRAQQKMDYCIAAGMQFTVGDRCQVRLEGSTRYHNATIKEVSPSNGPVTVHVEEMGRRTVPLWCLSPPSDESSWSTVVNRDRRLSNGHGGEWEERGRGRGRGKSVSASSSVSQAAGPGSSGRVQKQNSWPPQATVEEQGGAKTSRSGKLASSVELAFGLTKQERSAKEEEERNMALVEIQLRDEYSFPALGTQPGAPGEGGRKKGGGGGEKKRPQRNKTKSPVEDVRAASPSVADRPKSSTPPLSTTSAPPTNPAPPADPTLPAAHSDSSPACLSSLKASAPNVNMAAAASGSASSVPLTCAAPAAKPNAQSYASAAAAPTSPPPTAAPSTKPSALPHVVPSSASIFSFVTPVLPAASSPQTPPAPSSSPPSSSPPPSSAVPPPTFIAPIAPSPTAAQGFTRSSPPLSSVPPCPPSPSTSSSSPPSAPVQQAPPVAPVQQAPPVAPVQQAPPVAPPAAAQTTNSLPKTGGTVTTPQTLHSQISHPQVSPPQTQSQVCVSQAEPQTPPSLPHVQAQSPASLPQNPVVMPPAQSEAPTPLLQPQSHADLPSVPPSEGAHIQPSHPPPGASSLHISQASHPPHPSQVPHPSLSLSTPVTHPCLQPPTAQNQPEAPPPPPQHPHPPESPACPPSQQSHPPHPQLLSTHPLPHPQSIPGAVPLQQMSQLYQDPLYPGFPQGEKGDMAPTPPFSSSKSGDDLPHDVNVLRFFFNLGIKAYSMPMFPPYIYLLPLQQAHTLNPKLSSRSPSPLYPLSNPPTRHQEAYPPPHYPPTSASVPRQYDHQAASAEPTRPSEPPFTQAGYSVTQPPPHRMPSPSLQWQQVLPPRNPSYTVGYTSTAPLYPHSSQGYHPGQGPGHPLYPPAPLGYQSSSTPEDLQVSQGAMEQLQHTNGDTLPGHGHIRVPGPVESPAAANVANANNRSMLVQTSLAHKEPGESSMTRVVLLVDPPLNNKPIHALVSDPGIKDSPVSMTTGNPSGGGSPGSPSPYRSSRSQVHPTKMYAPRGAPEPGQVGYPVSVPMVESQSVGCSAEGDWDDVEGFKHASLNHRGQRKTYRGGARARGGYDPGRGHRRRHGEMGAGYNYVQFSPSYRGRGRERGY